MNNWVHPTLVTVLIRKIVAAPGAHNVPSVNPRVTAVAEKRVASLTWRLIRQWQRSPWREYLIVGA